MKFPRSMERYKCKLPHNLDMELFLRSTKKIPRFQALKNLERDYYEKTKGNIQN